MEKEFKCPNCGYTPARCSRCNKKIGEHWTETMSSGKVYIKHSSMLPHALFNINYHTHEDVTSWKHPLIKKLDGQQVTLSWDADNLYKLCPKCNEELLQTLGRFFFLKGEF
jgi:hypothetical protein